MKKAAKIVVKGTVQGVFFRASTKEKACELGLRGFVRNRVEGTVEVVAEGHMAQLQKLADWCHIGPDHSIVDRVQINWLPYIAEFEKFTIN